MMIGLLASMVFLLGTTAGLRTVLALTDQLAGDQISLGVGDVEGRLFGHFVLHETFVDAPSVEIKLERVELTWQPLGLLSGAIHIERLKLVDGQVTIIESDSDDDPAKHGPGWLPDVDLEELDISTIQVTRGDKLYQIEQLSSQATLESQQLYLAHAKLQMPSFTASASGTADLQKLSVADVQLEWNWQSPQLLQPLTGTATLNGDADLLQLAATLSSPTQATLDIELSTPLKTPVWRAGFSMAQFNLQQDMSADLPDVVVSLEGNSTGNSETIKLDATGNVLFDNVSRPWQLNARVPLSSDGYPWLEMISGQASITIAPDEMRPDRAYVRVDIPDFGELWPDLAGHLQGEGELLGARRRPAIRMTVNGSNLIVGDYQAAQIDAEVQLDSSLSPEAPMQISARVEKAQVAGKEFDGEMQLEGSLRDARLDLRLIEAERGSIELSMKGGLIDDTLSTGIQHLALDHPGLGLWQTTETSALRISRTDGQLSRLCLNQSGANLCTELTWQGDIQASPHFNGSAKLQLPLIDVGEPATVFRQSMLKVQLDGADISVEGKSELAGQPLRLSGHGTVTSVDDWHLSLAAQADDVPMSAIPAINQQENLRFAGLMRMNLELAVDNTYKVEHLDAEFVLKDGMLKRTFIDGDEEELAIHTVHITAGKQQENLVIAGKLQDAYAGHLKMDFVLPAELDQLSKPDMPLNGRLVADFPGLQAFSIFLDDVTLPQGTLSADIFVEGTRAAPQLQGSAMLEVPRLDLSVPEINFDDTSLAIKLDGNELSARGDSQINGRPLTLEGHAVLHTFSDWDATLQLAGDSISLENVFGSSLQTSPDLTVAVTPGKVNLTGDIVVEGSDIFIRDISTSVRPSSDVIIVDEEQNVSPDWHIVADLGLRLTGNNRLRVTGFNGLLGGNVRVRSETGKLASGEGVLTVNEGVYRAFGTTVPIQRGRLEFIGGALDDPALHIESRRRVQMGEVGFDVTGTLQSPIVTLVSSPTMEQSEILSWLLFDRGAGDTEGVSTALLASSIQTALGREEEESFMQRMLNRMGMTNMEVVTDTSGVGLSQQLTPRLFVKYQVNVWNQTESRLILRYLLNQHWALEGISGDEGGGDIIYEREH
jgi:autotransporter translocation and assembly factor TamB